VGKKGVSAHRKRCFGDIEIYPTGDDCDVCVLINDCWDAIVEHIDTARLVEFWGLAEAVWFKCSRTGVLSFDDDKNEEVERRQAQLSRWVRDRKGNDWFARSLVKSEDQADLLAIWLIRDGLRAATGKHPPLQAMADAFWKLMGQRKSRQQIDRLQAKLDKLEDAEGPWAAK